MISERIRQIRKSMNWTQKEMAEKLHFRHRETVARWENGTRTPENSTLYLIELLTGQKVQ